MTEPSQESIQDQSAQEPSQESGGEAQRAFTQEDVNRIAANEKREGRSSVLGELGFDDLDELKEAIEAYRTIEAETQTEAEKYQKELEKLSPRAEKAERYERALTGYLETEREGLPEHITALLDRMDPVDQLEWIRTNREAITPQEQRPPRRSPDASVRQAPSDDPRQEVGRFLGSLLQG